MIRPEIARMNAWSQRWGFAVGLAAVFGTAIVVRLTGALRGSGLHGIGNYDDGVHFAAALGLVNGLLPYRDFLLLHPPGVVLVLAPFAALSWLIGEPDAMVVARLVWMVLGGLNAALCGVALRPIGVAAGLIGALFYALFQPAIYVEHTTLLEAPATTVLLLAIVLIRLLGSSPGVKPAHYLAAGFLIGLSPVLKIWGVVAVLVLVIAVRVRRGRRPAMTMLVGAVATCTAACLPFFLAAPGEMWRMIVVAQVGRRRVSDALPSRLNNVLGTREWVPPGQGPYWSAWLVAMSTVVILATVICLVRVELRVAAALLITHGILVLVAPMWFAHYAGLTAAPIALVIGGSVGVLLDWAAPRRWLQGLIAGLTVAGILLLALPLRHLDLGEGRFPARQLGAAVAEERGCVTTDWPMTLIQMDLLQRNIDRRCRFVVDLGGYSYYLTDSAYHDGSRRKNKDWQALALDYYRCGDAVLAVRFTTSSGFSPSTAREVRRWPVIVASHGYVIRRPGPSAGSPRSVSPSWRRTAARAGRWRPRLRTRSPAGAARVAAVRHPTGSPPRHRCRAGPGRRGPRRSRWR